MNNIVCEIANIFGVMLEEEFEVINNKRNGDKEKYPGIYKFSENGRLWHQTPCTYANNWTCADEVLSDLIAGHAKITTGKFHPRKNCTYYTYGNYDFRVIKAVWQNHVLDHMRLYCGTVFRSAAEAEKRKDYFMKKLVGKISSGGNKND